MTSEVNLRHDKLLRIIIGTFLKSIAHTVLEKELSVCISTSNWETDHTEVIWERLLSSEAHIREFQLSALSTLLYFIPLYFMRLWKTFLSLHNFQMSFMCLENQTKIGSYIWSG